MLLLVLVFKLVQLINLDSHNIEHNVLANVLLILIFMEMMIQKIVFMIVQIQVAYIHMLIQLIDNVKLLVYHFSNIITDV